MMRTDSTHDPDLVDQAEKVLVKSNQQYENNILIYCILNAELNIILLYWNKQHFESSIIKWGCCLLDENFHLVLMFTCFGSVQTCTGLNVEPSGLHIGAINQYLPSKQTSARGGKAYPYNGFLNFFSTCSSAIWRLTSSSWSSSKIWVIRSSNLVKIAMTGTVKCKFGTWKRWGAIETFSCPRLLKELCFQWQ